MKKEKIKYSIVKYLEDKGFIFGGVIARAIHDLTGAKEGIVERRMRELAEEGVLERTYEQVEGKGPRVVLFRLMQMHHLPKDFAVLKNLTLKI